MAAVKKAIALAEDPQGKKLALSFNGKTIESGTHVPKAKARTTPTLSYEASDGPYLAVMLDLDAPFASTPFLSPILHWIQPGFQGSPESGSQMKTDLRPVAEYGPPGPPGLSGPHRYVTMLYKQPEGFDGKKFGQPDEGKSFPISKRMRYDFEGFLREAKLGEPLAAHYFKSN